MNTIITFASLVLMAVFALAWRAHALIKADERHEQARVRLREQESRLRTNHQPEAWNPNEPHER